MRFSFGLGLKKEMHKTAVEYNENVYIVKHNTLYCCYC